MPVLHTCGNIYRISGTKYHGFFAPLLIVAAPAHAYECLPAAFGRLVDVPVVAATRLKGYIHHGYTIRHNRGYIALSDEILGIRIVGFAHRENNGLCIRFERGGSGTVRRISPNLLSHAECCPRFRPTGIKGGMGQDFGYFCFGYAVLLCRFEVILERRIGQSLRHEGDNGNDGTVAEREQVIATPYLSEENIVVQTGELGGKLTKRIAPGGLFDFYL